MVSQPIPGLVSASGQLAVGQQLPPASSHTPAAGALLLPTPGAAADVQRPASAAAVPLLLADADQQAEAPAGGLWSEASVLLSARGHSVVAPAARRPESPSAAPPPGSALHDERASAARPARPKGASATTAVQRAMMGVAAPAVPSIADFHRLAPEGAPASSNWFTTPAAGLDGGKAAVVPGRHGLPGGAGASHHGGPSSEDSLDSVPPDSARAARATTHMQQHRGPKGGFLVGGPISTLVRPGHAPSSLRPQTGVPSQPAAAGVGV